MGWISTLFKILTADKKTGELKPNQVLFRRWELTARNRDVNVR
jgi:hypothetical protein